MEFSDDPAVIRSWAPLVIPGRAKAQPMSALDEVLALADRIAVMYRGKIVGIVGADATRETLGKMMAGVSA